MQKSLIEFSQKHKIPYKLTKSNLEHLQKYNCCLFCKQTLPLRKTYQNFGLKQFKRGFIKTNILPLCKLCYIIRVGQSLKQLIKRIESILFRIPQVPLLTFPQNKLCKAIQNKQYCKSKCEFCSSKNNLTIDQIIPNKGYTFKNIQTLCWTCNRTKSYINQKTFFKHLKRLYLNFQSNTDSSKSL